LSPVRPAPLDDDYRPLERSGEHRIRLPAALPRILIVDDTLMVLRSLKRVLEVIRPEWSIAATQSPKAALIRIRNERFSVLLTDLEMPEMCGEELVKAALGVDPNLVCLVHSGKVETLKPEIRSKLSDVLRKPATANELSEALDRAVKVSERSGRRASRASTC